MRSLTATDIQAATDIQTDIQKGGNYYRPRTNDSKRVSSIIPTIQNSWGTLTWGGSDMVKGKTESQGQKNRSARGKRRYTTPETKMGSTTRTKHKIGSGTYSRY